MSNSDTYPKTKDVLIPVHRETRCTLEVQDSPDIREIVLPTAKDPANRASVLSVEMSLSLDNGRLQLHHTPFALHFLDASEEVAFAQQIDKFFEHHGYDLRYDLSQREIYYIAKEMRGDNDICISWADDLFFEPEEAMELNRMIAMTLVEHGKRGGLETSDLVQS